MLFGYRLEDSGLVVDLVLRFVDIVVESSLRKKYFRSPQGSRKARAVQDWPTRPALPISWNISFMLSFFTNSSRRMTLEMGKLVP